MGAVAATLLLCLIAMATALMPMVKAIDESPEAVEKWFKELGKKKEKTTKIHFYLHDSVSGSNITSLTVAQPSPVQPNQFGQINVLDDPLTVGPTINSSTILGRAQGIYLGAHLGETDLLITWNFAFTSGKYNGSTLSIFGRNPILDTYRELAVVGGSGVFRLARGIATAKTYSFNTTSLNAVVEYHVVVIHY